ncbi:biliverdin-producing heme oxygenase [Sphingobacterium sp. LRF_L2]|uniref:biliverdin-producing heme oxygenase n=1 Tax=Sphingobacterium sp. LRF_L2 TaxID=3369421 RepID=UPI003F63B064
MILSQNIKENTTASHQKLEGIVVRQLKAVRSNADYADVLKNFYAYFSSVEKAIAPFITTEVLADYAERRDSSYIKQDIEELGSTIDDLPVATAPKVTNTLEALSALYVLEGSIMGGPYIVQMLNKYGITSGTSFFSGYGEDTGKMWAAFTSVLNKYGEDPATHEHAVAIANETFSKFGDVFAASLLEK